MLALGIRYLCNWAMATHPADRSRAEWPPHPARVFMALAAAHFETDLDPAEREILELLETLDPPCLTASGHEAREVVTSFVPVNDPEIARGRGSLQARLTGIQAQDTLKEAKNAGLDILPEHRSRQPRSFPVAIPHDPIVHLIWPEAKLTDRHRQVLHALCGKVSCLGHSASLVQMWVESNPPGPTLIPRDGPSQYRLRVIGGSGCLQAMQERFDANLRPTSSLWSGYDVPTAASSSLAECGTCFDPNLIVLRRLSGPAMGLESTFQLTKTLRDTVIKRCPIQPPPEWVSGHQPDGQPTRRNHLAFAPLPHVGVPHADGHLLGLAMAVPADVTPQEQAACWRDVLFSPWGEYQSLTLRMGSLGVWELRGEDRFDPPLALTAGIWIKAAPRWATVTPIVLDRHPRGSDTWKQIEESIAAGCERIGLPRPLNVDLSPTSIFQGVPHARIFPMMQRKTGGNRHHTHAILTFPQKVRGPILLGAGRYRGYGLCRPLGEGDER